MKYELIINDIPYHYDNLNDDCKKISDELYNHFNIKQCYNMRMPFSAGVLEYELYDNNTITDEQIVVFQRIYMLLNRLAVPNESFEFIKHNYNLHYEDDYSYDFNIIKEDDDVILKITVDCIDHIDILETNMFNMNNNSNYYFKSIQTVVFKSKEDTLELGDIIKLEMILKNEEYSYSS